jgi:hypothetical protein
MATIPTPGPTCASLLGGSVNCNFLPAGGSSFPSGSGSSAGGGGGGAMLALAVEKACRRRLQRYRQRRRGRYEGFVVAFMGRREMAGTETTDRRSQSAWLTIATPGLGYAGNVASLVASISRTRSGRTLLERLRASGSPIRIERPSPQTNPPNAWARLRRNGDWRWDRGCL